MSETARVEFAFPATIDGRQYKPGEVAELPKDQADQLVRDRMVRRQKQTTHREQREAPARSAAVRTTVKPAPAEITTEQGE